MPKSQNLVHLARLINGRRFESRMVLICLPKTFKRKCQKEKKIDLTSIGYYEEMHERFKSTEAGKRTLRALLQDNIDGMKLGEKLDTLRPEISVKGMGGWECGKCHY